MPGSSHGQGQEQGERDLVPSTPGHQSTSEARCDGKCCQGEACSCAGRAPSGFAADPLLGPAVGCHAFRLRLLLRMSSLNLSVWEFALFAMVRMVSIISWVFGVLFDVVCVC